MNKLKKILCELFHVVILTLLVVAVLQYYTSKDNYIDLPVILDNIIAPFIYIPYVHLITGNSNTSALNFIGIIYALVSLMFFNIFIASFPLFSVTKKEKIDISSNGLSKALDTVFYNNVMPSISLSFLFRSTSNSAKGLVESHSGDNWQSYFYKNLQKSSIRDPYILTFLTCFTLFPYMAFDRITYDGLTVVPFWLIVLVMVYGQIRFISELCLFVYLIFINKGVK